MYFISNYTFWFSEVSHNLYMTFNPHWDKEDSSDGFLIVWKMHKITIVFYCIQNLLCHPVPQKTNRNVSY